MQPGELPDAIDATQNLILRHLAACRAIRREKKAAQLVTKPVVLGDVQAEGMAQVIRAQNDNISCIQPTLVLPITCQPPEGTADRKQDDCAQDEQQDQCPGDGQAPRHVEEATQHKTSIKTGLYGKTKLVG